jgi:NCS2 family nucleobase:cation symporter-2
MMGGNPKAENWGDPANIGLAAMTLAIVIIFSMLKSQLIRRLAILMAIVLGTIIASLAGFADFSKVANDSVFAFPHIFHFGMPVFEFTAILSMVIVTLVIMTETTADIIAIGEIVVSKVDSKWIGDGLRADMLSSAVAPIFGSFMQTAFAQNVGLGAITGIKSRFVVATAGGILVVLGLLPIVGRLVAAIPMPVLGGAGIVLYCIVWHSGRKWYPHIGKS